MAAKKKSAIEARQGHPTGIIDDIINVGSKLIRPKTRDAAKVYLQAGTSMRRSAKQLGKLSKEYNSTSRSGLAGDANVIRGKELRKQAKAKMDDVKLGYGARKGTVRAMEKEMGKPLKRVAKNKVSEAKKLEKMANYPYGKK